MPSPRRPKRRAQSGRRLPALHRSLRWRDSSWPALARNVQPHLARHTCPMNQTIRVRLAEWRGDRPTVQGSGRLRPKGRRPPGRRPCGRRRHPGGAGVSPARGTAGDPFGPSGRRTAPAAADPSDWDWSVRSRRPPRLTGDPQRELTTFAPLVTTPHASRFMRAVVVEWTDRAQPKRHRQRDAVPRSAKV